MYKRAAILISIIFLNCLLSGCYDAREVDDWAFVSSVGIDKGINDKLSFSVCIPTLKNSMNNSGGTQGPAKKPMDRDFTVISIECPTIYSGANLINTSLSRKVIFSQAKYLVISEELAKKGVEEVLNGVVRTSQIRRNMYIIVVKGRAKDFLEEFNPVLGTAVSKTQEDMMGMEGETGLLDAVTYNQFLDDMKSYYRNATATMAAINDFSHYNGGGSGADTFKGVGDYNAGELPRDGGNRTEFLGAGIFRGDKLVGELTGEETRAKLMVTNEFKKGTIAVEDPKSPYVMAAAVIRLQRKTQVRVKFEGEKPIITIKLSLEGDLANLQSNHNYETRALRGLLEEKFSEYIKGILDKTIDKCKDLDSDVFHFGDYAAMHFPTIQEFEAYNWKEHFKDAQVNTEVKFTIRRTGTMLRTNPTVKTEEDKQ